jgi:hypothetical protein
MDKSNLEVTNFCLMKLSTDMRLFDLRLDHCYVNPTNAMSMTISKTTTRLVRSLSLPNLNMKNTVDNKEMEPVNKSFLPKTHRLLYRHGQFHLQQF